jgi:hypothetical protein
MATDDKHHETRSWGTSYRGRLAIHAAKMTRAQRDMCMEGPYQLLLAVNGYASPKELPSGAIIALGDLVDCFLITREVAVLQAALDPTDVALGDWTPGRFAWEFRLRTSLQYDPIPARGYQGLWTPEGFDL